MDDPLIFSMDDHFVEEHLVRLDLRSKHLKHIDQLPNNIDFNVILLDKNELTEIAQLDRFAHLIQLSVSHNRLTSIHLLHRLRSLQKLDLKHNLIDSVDGLKTLHNLTLLNISHNNVASIAVLNNCSNLQSIDASDNYIQQIEDLSRLTSLKYLNLHKNFLHTLNSALRYWPKSLHTLIISDNEIQDLTEVAHLTSFVNLNTLYIIDNPCLSVVDEKHGCHQPFDYRPFILNWCLSIHNLDGLLVTRKESLKSEWLLSQGKGRSFGSGEHAELVRYLTRVCGTDGNEKEDTNLSQIIHQKDLHNQQRYSEHSNEPMMITSDTIRDASETLSHNTHSRYQQGKLISESEFIKSNTSSSATSGDDESISFIHQRQMRTPSPAFARSAHVNIPHIDDPPTENSSSSRYIQYDDRPIKPLDQNMLQVKLNEYPIDSNDVMSHSRSHMSGHSQPIRPSTSALPYNAAHYSPKAATSEPTHSSFLARETARVLANRPNSRKKLQRRNTIHVNPLQPLEQLQTYVKQNSTVIHANQSTKHQALIDTSQNKRNYHTENDTELHSKSVPVNTMLSTRSTTMNNTTTDLEKLTTSVETVRTSILLAYIDLHERFTKATELQTSALSALWKKCETQNLTHQRETEKIIEQNRLLSQRIHELEGHLRGTKEPSSVTQISSKHNPNIHPPLRAHISKRDAKSCFLHWIPNTLNQSQTILGYRIYVDDILKGAVDANKFEAIVDYIRDEGEYRIKIRTYNQEGESTDSNIVIARFHRQNTVAVTSEGTTSRRRTQSERIGEDKKEKQSNEELFMLSRNRSQTPIIMDKRRSEIEQSQENISVAPERETIVSDEHDSSIKTSPHITRNDYTVTGKPPISPTSSPSRMEKKSPSREFSSAATKRSPIRSGIMSRLTRSSNKVKHNLLNVLPMERSNSPTESTNISKTETTSAKRTITFPSDVNSNDHERLSTHQYPMRSIFDPTTSIDMDHFMTHSDTFISSSPSLSTPSQTSAKHVRPNSIDQ
ncbi:unnamed protein product [Adineta ricciae]|uniref:Centrosomal protein of 97 kDa n=1 Tax=Adineta ricciae TaxID=249248 RepID=A0A814B018_ADIRI|nr:unnamed protein product [Adineta ricciae]